MMEQINAKMHCKMGMPYRTPCCPRVGTRILSMEMATDMLGQAEARKIKGLDRTASLEAWMADSASR